MKKRSKMATSDNAAAQWYIIKYCVECEVPPKQTIEEMSSTQQYSSVNMQLVHKWHLRFSKGREETGA